MLSIQSSTLFGPPFLLYFLHSPSFLLSFFLSLVMSISPSMFTLPAPHLRSLRHDELLQLSDNSHLSPCRSLYDLQRHSSAQFPTTWSSKFSNWLSSLKSFHDGELDPKLPFLPVEFHVIWTETLNMQYNKLANINKQTTFWVTKAMQHNLLENKTCNTTHWRT